MLPQSRVGNGSSGRLISSQHGRHAGAAWISARHQLLSDSWMGDVEKLERAIGRFKVDSNVANDCEVVFFEIAGDGHLHCNVTHRHETKAVTGWAGPGHVPDGFVHNRRFGDIPHNDMVRQIRDMVFAARV
ncbi:MAG TPA: hypothetical protein VGD94_15600 [Vicinamibacterales bacterium]